MLNEKKDKKDKSPTLRAYLESYQSLRRVKSSENLIFHEPHSPTHKTSSELSQQINNKINQIKKALETNDLNKIRNTILAHFFDLQTLIENVFSKLLFIEDKAEINKMSNPNIFLGESKVSTNKLRKESLQSLPVINQVNVNGKFDQLAAPLMSRQIKFSTTLTNLGQSLATQDLTPRYFKQKKQSSIEQSMKPQAEKFFTRTIKPMVSLTYENPQNEVHTGQDNKIIYQIKVHK